MTVRCARCRRVLSATPTFIGGKGYGPVCAEKVAPSVSLGQRPRLQVLPAPAPRQKRIRLFTVVRKKAAPAEGDPLQLDLLGEVA